MWRYRSKMEFSFGVLSPEENGPWLSSVQGRKRWNKVIDVGSCLLPESVRPSSPAEEWALAERPYNGVKKLNFLHYRQEAANTVEAWSCS